MLYSPPVGNQVLSNEPLPDPEQPSSGPESPRFSLVLTSLSAIILFGSAVFFGWLQLSVPRLERVSMPERALELTVGRMMDLEEALNRAPEGERALYKLIEGESQALGQSITWYQELAADSRDPLVHCYLTILEAEDGRLDRVRQRIDQWEVRREPFPSFARLIRAAYFGPRPDPAAGLRLQAELAETLPDGWFYDRLAMHLAMRMGDRALFTGAEGALLDRGAPLLERSRWFLASQLAMMLAGVLVLLALLLRREDRRPDLRVAGAPIPPLWRGRTGLVVLIRGGAIGALAMLSVLFMDHQNPWLRIVAIPAINLPVILLARRHLLQPTGLGLRQGLGLRLPATGWSRLGLAVPLVLALGLLGEWGLNVATGWLELLNHWTEWFDEDLAWGTPAMLGAGLCEYVLLAPVFEEIVFRGFLFGTLRRKFGWIASAAISASLFAVAHGYGAVGFANVFWSGLLWAWSYEKTGSLLPGILAHALNNLVVCLTVIAMLRG